MPKLGDFGSARSATEGGYPWAEQAPPDRADSFAASPAGPRAAGGGSGGAGKPLALHREDSFGGRGNEAEAHAEDLYALPEEGGKSFRAPLTRLVATPCYR